MPRLKPSRWCRGGAAGAAIAAAATALGLTLGCGGPAGTVWGREGAPSDGRVKIATSIFPFADLARRVGGDRVDVISLIPPGTSEHTWEPAPRLIARVSRIRLFYRVGAGFEPWVSKLLEASGSSFVTVDGSEGLDLIHESTGFDGGFWPGTAPWRPDIQTALYDARSKGEVRFAARMGEARTTSASERQAGANPHYWLDPLAMKPGLERLAAALSSLDPAGAEGYRERCARTLADLDALDAEFRDRTSRFTSRQIVTFHEAWDYFAHRYGLRVAAAIEEFPGKEPGPRHIAQIVRVIRAEGIRCVFAEPQFPSKAADVIAEECHVPVYLLDPLGGEGIAKRGDYFSLMRYNVGVMEQVLR